VARWHPPGIGAVIATLNISFELISSSGLATIVLLLLLLEGIGDARPGNPLNSVDKSSASVVYTSLYNQTMKIRINLGHNGMNHHHLHGD